MTDLQKRASRPAPASIDSYTLDDVVTQVDTVLESGDGEIAQLVVKRIVKASRAGEWGFDPTKLGRLVVLAGELAKITTNEGGRP